ncbi:fibronectin type III domain-containing protein [Paenibacillus planticolens]|uniref:Dockerin domain-containing protein n=1 Tax=Paenibacillus planticolens TaxID=2654976 RepID=A0ABX1ZPQ5_9BACL|nr:fibronectin type III domain-containing protein [Paenibacillus planticolens]NOV00585.1 hypothetical protein [Paenibacillus planticolens]
MFSSFSLKKRSAKISILVMSVLVALPLMSDGFAGYGNITPVGIVSADAVTYIPKDIALNPGTDATELRLTWYSSINPVASIVQMAKKSDMTDTNFPAAKAVAFTGTVSPAATVGTTLYYSNKVTVTGLQPSTQYVYRVGDGNDTNWSPVYNFDTQRTDEFSVMFVGDPQIGASGSVTKDTEGWTDTLNKAVAKLPNLSFIMSAGDQVEHATTEAEYDAFESPIVLRSLPVATTVGNHDTNVNYKYHFNQPNESTKYGVTNASGDYYYTYGDALFMVLNTNNTNGASHVQFMKETVAAVPNMKWKFVTFHHDIYGAGPHSTEAVITGLRAALFPTFDELDVDMIFMGHDHSYVRTYVMKGDIPQKNQLIDSEGRVVNPTGATYLTANSASGSKYYELMTTPEIYSEVRSQLKVPTFSTINVSPSSVKINTYRTDTMAVVDTYSMVKDHAAPTYTLKANGAPFVDSTVYKDNQTVSFELNTQDQETSVVSQSITLDGNPYTNGTPIDLSGKLGVHTLNITAADYAGNKLDTTLSFSVVARDAVTLNATLTGTSSVGAGQSFGLNYGLTGVTQPLYAQDLTLTFDPAQFELISAEPLVKDQLTVVTSEKAPGQVRILLASLGGNHAVSTDGDLLKLNFKAKSIAQSVTGTVTLKNITVANANGVETPVSGASQSVQITVITRDPGDLNGDNKVSIGDLAMVAAWYGKTSADPNWEQYKIADMNNDGIIDIADLAAVAQLILQN